MTTQPDHDALDDSVNRSASGIKNHQKLQLCRELAAGEIRRSDLARKYGVSAPAITQFARRNATRIEEIREHLDDQYAGLWLADKVKRLESYEQDLEMSLDSPRANHFEQIRTRTQIRQAMAEELGQLPARGIAVTGSVTHILEGVSVEELQ